jgi:hypothetical protein
MGAGDHPAQVGIANAYRIVRLLSAQLTWSVNKENRDGEGTMNDANLLQSGKERLRMRDRASAETTWPRRALCVGLMISPKLDLNGPCESAVDHTRKIRGQSERKII